MKLATRIGNSPSIEKKTENQYIIVKISVTNNDKEARTIDSGLFTLASMGERYKALADADIYVNDGNGKFLNTKINPGGTATGYIVFDTPKDVARVGLICASGVGTAGGTFGGIFLGI